MIQTKDYLRIDLALSSWNANDDGDRLERFLKDLLRAFEHNIPRIEDVLAFLRHLRDETVIILHIY